MFDVGFWELCLIGIVGLMVLGPERLPEAARTVGGWIRKIKTIRKNLTQEIERELDIAELRKELEEKNQTIIKQANSLADKLNTPVEKLTSLDEKLQESISEPFSNAMNDDSKSIESKTNPDGKSVSNSSENELKS